MTAEEFRIFIDYMREEYGAPRYKIAQALGCHRVTISKYEQTGSPPYIDLAIAAIVNDLDPWKPDREHQPNPALRKAVS
jgi:DNA-binding XRE family transcriptional regulator